MDYLWTPWRYTYLASAGKAPSCIFCDLQRSADDRKALIVHRAKYNFIILNAYPYTSGHSMVVPYEHIGRLHELPQGAASEMMELVQRMETVLYEVYQCDGVNLGMNVGKAAGAGVAGHIHMHVLPRWIADSNFMTVIGEARVLPELLEETYQRLKARF
ncbi:MAG TPA: HIT domain-containing protein [Terriglobales bacterium]|nr:HIT domain-containing protein [Terriglobales bacterium]